MPDEQRKKINYKFPNMLSKIFSFFQCKHHIQNFKDKEIEEEALDKLTHYRNLKSEDVMVPRSDIVAIDHKADLETITKVFINTRHTRMPVYENDLDNIKGFINIKDIFLYLVNRKENIEFEIDKIIRKMLIISPSIKILDLLEEMKKTRTHIALVVDEFGGTDGLITIEDLIEEIVGEIEDEHDQTKINDFKELSPGCFEVNGRIEIEALEEKLGILFDEVEKENYNTISGLILSISGHVPEKGEKIIHAANGLVFEILDSDLRRIKSVLVSKA